MKVQIRVQSIDETVVAPNADALLTIAKEEASKRAPLLLRGVVKKMNNLTFAAEVVKRDNQANKRNDPPPTSAQAFLDWAVARGYITILES